MVLLVLFVTDGKLLAQDSAKYLSKPWRDSVVNYEGRLATYRQELYSYDLGMTFGVLPVLGESYVGNRGAGIGYLVGRVTALAISVVGAVRLGESKPYVGLNVGTLFGGLAGWVALKFSELADIRHTVSERTENLVEQWHIATPDIEPHSIRYPTKDWPEWITSPPEARHPRNARDVDKPLPSSNE